MKKTYSVRKIDNLGRIVIPMDMRKALEIRDWDELKMYLEEDHVVIRKAKESCTFCGNEESLTLFAGKPLCPHCLAQLKKL